VGSRREEVVGKPFWETRWWNHSPELQEKLRAGVRFAAHGHVYRSEAEHPAADGRWRTVEFSLKPVMDTAGKVVMVIPEGHDITERKEFARNLLSAQERERKRLASELHDSLGQNLAVIKNHADTALQGAELPGPLAAHLQGIQRVAAEAIAETRNLAHNLRPPHIEQIGITESLRGLIHSVSQSTPVHFEFRLENVDDIFKGEAATNIYRIAQEALNNLVRHSRANQGSVTLERDVRSVRLRVVDDGVGFDSGNAASQNGLGLTSINERAHMLYGSLSIASTPGQGTELVVELPIPEDVAIVPET
jgi:PAS domain S-box-containing protein